MLVSQQTDPERAPDHSKLPTIDVLDNRATLGGGEIDPDLKVLKRKRGLGRSEFKALLALEGGKGLQEGAEAIGGTLFCNLGSAARIYIRLYYHWPQRQVGYEYVLREPTLKAGDTVPELIVGERCGRI